MDSAQLCHAPTLHMVRARCVTRTGNSCCGRAVKCFLGNLPLLLGLAVACFLMFVMGGARNNSEIPALGPGSGRLANVSGEIWFNRSSAAMCCRLKNGRRLAELPAHPEPTCVLLPCYVQQIAGAIRPTLGPLSPTAGGGLFKDLTFMRDTQVVRDARVYMLEKLRLREPASPHVADAMQKWVLRQMQNEPRLRSALGDAWAGLRETTASIAVVLT